MKNNQGQNQSLSSKQKRELLRTLLSRFESNRHRHSGMDWETVQDRLSANTDKLWSLHAMEKTGGEPDVVGQDKKSGEIIFYDCVPESPEGRRALCYDREGLESRKANQPDGDAVTMAEEMGVELLTEEQYFELQELGEFDTKTSSWLKTSSLVRELGGAIFGDRRYDRVFIYHNGAQSYYSSRGFRGSLRI